MREASPIFTCWNENVLPPIIYQTTFPIGDWFGKWNILNNAEKVDKEEKESKQDGISIGNISKVSAANVLVKL